MKKLFTMGLAALSLLLMVTSCESGEIEMNNRNNDKIDFDVVVGRQTRATEFTNTSWLDGTELTVKSYATGSTNTTPFKDFTLTYASSGSTWTASPAINQPGYSLTYYTWFPTTPTNFSGTGTAATMDYTIQSTQEDLLAATTKTADAQVDLAFNHILSQVNFALQGVKNVQIELTNIKINGVKNAATYTFSTTNAGSWGSHGNGTANYDYTPVGNTYKTDGTSDAIQYMGNKGGSNANDNANNNALMLMPQTFAAATDGNISFDFKLTAMDGSTVLANVTGTTYNLCDFMTTTWAIGKRYLYLIDFTEFLTKGQINFTVTVNGWTDADNNIANTIEVASASKASIEAAIARHLANTNSSTITVFPIALPAATSLSAAIPVDPGTGFDSGDVIKIECVNTTNAGHITLASGADTYWTRGASDSVVTFTRKQ
ncbi:fimbrillin family protein [Bacteroides sp. OttesenSCG-928-M17]|nr:fimbrillin family protein [Bacteroides sp. OttesenSCG-928-M17]